MVEVHGWITLRETYKAVDDENMEKVIVSVEKEIRKLARPLIQIKVNNGAHFVEFSLYTNHMSGDVKDLLDIFKNVGRLAEGSYGLLYIHNDEDEDGQREGFMVHRLARGRVNVFRDEFLSPLIPTVEDDACAE